MFEIDILVRAFKATDFESKMCMHFVLVLLSENDVEKIWLL